MFIYTGTSDYPSAVTGDLIAYKAQDTSLPASVVTGGILDRLDSFSDTTEEGAFLVPLGGTKILTANFDPGFSPGDLSFESAPCNSDNDCSNQQANGAGFEEVDT